MDNHFDFRLSDNIVPLKYRITIEPIAPDYEIFKGICYIIYDAKIPTDNIIMHSLYIFRKIINNRSIVSVG